MGWGSQGGPSIEGVNARSFRDDVAGDFVDATTREAHRFSGRRAARAEDALTVALGFLNRWSEVRVLPGPPSTSSKQLE